MESILSSKLFTTRRGTIFLGVGGSGPGGHRAARVPEPVPQQRRHGCPPISVLVAKSLIQKGTPGAVIASTNVYQVGSIPKSQVKSGAFVDPKTLAGQVATTDIFPGQQLTASDFATGTGNSLTQQLAATSARWSCRWTPPARSADSSAPVTVSTSTSRSSRREAPGSRSRSCATCSRTCSCSTPEPANGGTSRSGPRQAGRRAHLRVREREDLARAPAAGRLDVDEAAGDQPRAIWSASTRFRWARDGRPDQGTRRARRRRGPAYRGVRRSPAPPPIDVIGYSDGIEEGWHGFLEQPSDLVIVACGIYTDAGDPHGRPGCRSSGRTGPSSCSPEDSPNGSLRQAFEAGADDVLALPQSPESLRFAIEKMIARRHGAASSTGTPTAPLVCVLGPKGGTGKTLVAANLSVALAQRDQRGSCSSISTCSSATSASRSGLAPERTIYDLGQGRRAVRPRQARPAPDAPLLRREGADRPDAARPRERDLRRLPP